MRRLLPILVLLFGCRERRKPIAIAGDAGPAVVVVDPTPHKLAAALPQVPLVDEKEPDDDLAHAQPLEPQKGIKGTLAAAHVVKGKPASDVDVYVFTEMGAGGDGGARFHEARITLAGVAGVDLVLTALDGDGKKLAVANEGGAGEGEILPNLAVEPGRTYYLEVKAAGAPPAAETAPYQLVMQSQPAPAGAEKEPNDDAAPATQLESMSEASGFYGKRHDEDFLALPVQLPGAGGILRVELGAVDGVAPLLKISNDKEVIAAARAPKGEELRLRNVGVPPGASRLIVELKAAEGKNLDARWLIKVGVEPPLEGAEKEPNDGVAQANAVQAGQSLSGFLWPGDADVYCIAQEFVLVEADGLEGVDLKLDRLTPQGKVLQHADDAGTGKGEKLPPVPGASCVRVSGRARDAAFDAPYRISFREIGASDDLEREPNDAAASATHIPDGRTAMRGWLAPKGDEDWYRFTAPAGKAKVTVHVDGGALPMALKLVDENKMPLQPATSKTSASGPIVPGKSYLVSVRAQEHAADALNPYNLTLTFE